MILELATIKASVQDQLTVAEKADEKRFNRALNNCLDDLTDRLVSVGLLTSDTDTIAANSRTATITGVADDLRYLFRVKYGSGDSENLLTFVDADQFLKRYDNPSASQGVPKYFTILSSDGGDPVIKFDVPTLNSDTLTYYYFPDITSNNLSQLRSGSAVVIGTLAWFWGITDGAFNAAGAFEPGRGARAYSIYLEKVKQMRASDHFLAKSQPVVGINEFDREVRSVANTMRNRRS